MTFLSKDLHRLKPAFSIGLYALKLKYVLLVSCLIALQFFLAYRGFVEVSNSIDNGRSWGAVMLFYGLFFFMTGWVAITLTSRLSYAAVVLRNVRKKDPWF